MPDSDEHNKNWSTVATTKKEFHRTPPTTYSDDDTFGAVCHYGQSGVGAVCLQTDGQIEKALVGVGFAFLSHVVGCCFVEM